MYVCVIFCFYKNNKIIKITYKNDNINLIKYVYF